MSIYILAAYSVPKDWSCDDLKGNEYRKATSCMRYAQSAINGLMNSSKDILEKINFNRLGVLVATGHGELEATMDFLKSIGPEKVVNPINFQNSLHNSTLGFITLKNSFCGPAMTTTNQYFSSESALIQACALLKNEVIDAAIVLGYDLIPLKYSEIFHKLYDQTLIPVKLKSGASCLLLCSEKFLKINSLNAIAKLNKVEINFEWDKSKEQVLIDHYDADGIEKIVNFLNSKNAFKKIVMLKPDGSSSAISLSAP